MTTRIQVAIGIIAALFVFPFLIVYAQSEGDVTASSTEEVTTEESSTSATNEEASTTEESASQEGDVLGETDEATEEAGEPTESAATSSEPELFTTTSASSSEATSTPPVEEPAPIEEPYVLQPSVDFQVNGNDLSAAVTLQNLTCKSCEKTLPALDVAVYYTPWYPNDGPIESYSDSNTRIAVQESSVNGLANWSTRGLSWSAENVTPGRYYFVVEVDPEDEHGAYNLFRSEFSI